MDEVQTGSEPTVVVPEEVSVEEVILPDDIPATPPVKAEEVPEQSADDVLDKLERDIQKKTPTRKEAAIEKWNKRYDSTMTDGEIDMVALNELYEKNPKGLEAFAEKNDLDVDSLRENFSPEEDTSELADRLSVVEARVMEQDEVVEKNEFKGKLTALTAQMDITVGDFYKEYGDDFTSTMKKFTSQGLSLLDATDAAFALTAGKPLAARKEVLDEKQNVLDTVKDMPEGMPAGDQKHSTLLTRNDVSAMNEADRVAYKKQFNQNGIPVYSDGNTKEKDTFGRQT